MLVVPKPYNDVPLVFRKRPTNNHKQQNKNPHKPQKNKQTFFFGRRPLPFGWSPTLRLACGPAGNRTTTGSLSALSKDTALPTSPQGRLQKNKQTTENQTPRRNQWNRSIITRCSEKWCDKATCVPSTEQAIRWKQQEENKKQHRMGDWCQSKKVAMPKPRIPPARIPEIACEAVQA